MNKVDTTYDNPNQHMVFVVLQCLCERTGLFIVYCSLLIVYVICNVCALWNLMLLLARMDVQLEQLPE